MYLINLLKNELKNYFFIVFLNSLIKNVRTRLFKNWR